MRQIALRTVSRDAFDIPNERPEIGREMLRRLCDAAYAEAGSDWLVVYGDREHSGNLIFLTGFDPRFEEALLVLGGGGRRSFIVGNECRDYAEAAPAGIADVKLAQTMSLMGQDRSKRPRLEDALRECGLKAGDAVAVVGWKYLEPEEWDGDEPGLFIPAFVEAVLRRIVGPAGRIKDATPVLLDPEVGLRAVIGAEHIALHEWGAARASAALWRALSAIRAGESELEAAARMGYAGEPLSCHTMLNSAGPDASVIGLRSPTARRLRRGDGASVAVGYWGGLSARAGLVSDGDDDFLRVAQAYFAGILAWYDAIDIGVAGGAVFEAVRQALAQGGLASALNPGHLTGFEEWTHTPIRPGSTDAIRSGMPFQVDIIPQPMRQGWALNCEDGIVIADGDLRSQLRTRFPEVYARIEARRRFVSHELGIDLKDCVLPLSSTPLCLPPFWLTPDRLLAVD
jgi:Xaa-Pro aminopeptidase